MKSLHTLLNLAKRELETLRRALAAETARQEAIERNIAALDQNLLAEQQRASGDPFSGFTYAAFAARKATDRRVMSAEARLIGAQCDRLRALVEVAHVETRKFERLLELRDQRERAAAVKREDAELDELATMRAGRSEAAGR